MPAPPRIWRMDTGVLCVSGSISALSSGKVNSISTPIDTLDFWMDRKNNHQWIPNKAPDMAIHNTVFSGKRICLFQARNPPSTTQAIRHRHQVIMPAPRSMNLANSGANESTNEAASSKNVFLFITKDVIAETHYSMPCRACLHGTVSVTQKRPEMHPNRVYECPHPDRLRSVVDEPRVTF